MPTILATSRIAWNKCPDTHLLNFRNEKSRNVTDLIENEYPREDVCILNPKYVNFTLTNILKEAAYKLPKSTLKKRAETYWSKEVKTAHVRAIKKTPYMD